MIHPENADEAADRLLMLICDLGVGLPIWLLRLSPGTRLR